MKKIILTLSVATALSITSLQANEECPSNGDRIGFGVAGVLQGIAVGGPVGAFWGLGTILFADYYKNGCEAKPTQTEKTQSTELNNKQESSETEESSISAEDRIGFGTAGVLQGIAVGGPVGAFWGLSTILFADNYKNDCKAKPTQTEKTQSTELNNKQESSETKESSVSVDDRLDNASENSTNEMQVKGYVVIPSIVQFAFDSYKIPTIPQKLSALKNDEITSITIAGHTDSVGSVEYNFALGAKRANAVKSILVDQGIESEKLSTVSYGESNPISDKDYENRRVDLNINYSDSK